jgi:hypothetical protein
MAVLLLGARVDEVRRDGSASMVLCALLDIPVLLGFVFLFGRDGGSGEIQWRSFSTIWSTVK